MKPIKITRRVSLILGVLIAFTLADMAHAKKVTIVTWGVQCFLGKKIGECGKGKPIRFEVRAADPQQARRITNAAGARKGQWNRCFKVSRKIHDIPTCDPKSGRVSK